MGEGTSALEQEPRRTDSFAEHLLMAALRAPGAASSTAAARTIAGLIGLLASEGADREVAAMLAPTPDSPATFDVLTAGGPPDASRPVGPALSPRPVLTGQPVARALREASRLAQGNAGLISVVAVGPDGLRRRVLDRANGAPFLFVFPSETAFEGEPAACAEAVNRWHRFLFAPAGPQALVAPVVALPTADESDPATADAAAPAAELLDPEALADTIREALSDVTVEVDMGAIEQVVDGALRAALATARTRETPTPTEPPGGWVTHAALLGAAEQLHVLMESFNDRIRSGSRSLEALADELSSRDRTAAAFTDALGRSINTSIDRMLRHIDDRLDQLPARGTGPAPEATHPSA